jgi:hypothetical protein
MDMLTLTGLVTSGITLLDGFDLNPLKLLGQQLSPKVVSYVKTELFGEPTYRQRIAEIVDQLMAEYRTEYKVDPLSPTIYFFQTQWLWNRVLTYQLFQVTPSLQPEDFPALPRLLRPSQAELTQFNTRVAAAMAADPELSKRFYEEKHQEITVQFALAAAEQLNRVEAMLHQQVSPIQPLLDMLEKNELEKYKPFTTVRMLGHLATEVARYPDDHRLQARYHYLLGRAHQETSEMELAHEHFLQSYALEPAVVEYAEQAALTYARLEMPAETDEAVATLRRRHPLSGVAYAVIVFQQRADFEQQLMRVPRVVRQTEKFKLALAALLLQVRPLNLAQLEAVFETDLVQYTPASELTSFNRRFQRTLALLVVQLELATLPPLLRFDQPAPLAGSARLTAAYELLRRYTEMLQPTEQSPLLMHYYYVQGLAGFLLTGQLEELAEFGRRYATLAPAERADYAPEWSLALYQSGAYAQALEVLNELEQPVPAELDYLRYLTLLQLGEAEAAKAALAQHLQHGGPLHAGTYDRALRYLRRHCPEPAERQAFVNNCRTWQLIEPETLPDQLLRALASPAGDTSSQDWCATLDRMADLLTPDTPTILRLELAQLYQMAEKYEQSAHLLVDCPLDLGIKPTGVEFLRLRNQYHLYQDGAALRAGLRTWRQQVGIDPEFCIWEVELARYVLDWERILEVAEAVKDQFSARTGAFSTYLHALYRLDRLPQLAAALEQVATQPSLLTSDQLLNAAGMAMQTGHTLLALRLAYPLANNSDNLAARSRYLALMVHRPDDPPQPEVAAPGSSVRYTLNGKPQRRFVLPEEISGSRADEMARQLLGKQVGDTFTVTNALHGRPQAVEILEITDRYVGLYQEIMSEIDQHEAVMPFQKFDFGSATPTLDEMHRTFQHLFGEQQRARRAHVTEVATAYRMHELTFTQLAGQLHQGNGLEAYHWLISGRDDSPGVRVLSATRFGAVPDLLQRRVVLDWTSLPLLFDLTQTHQLPLPASLWASNHLLEELRTIVREKQRSRPSTMSVEVLEDEVRPHMYPPEMHARHIGYLISLLTWVEAHCQTRFAEEKLDVCRQMASQQPDANIFEQPLASVLDAAFLASGGDAVVISDDATLLQLVLPGGVRVLSTEAFLRAHYPQQYLPQLLPELLDRHYWGIQVEVPTLVQEFQRSEYRLEGRARQALRNAALQVAHDPARFQTLAHFVRELYLLPGASKAQRREAATWSLLLGLCYLALDENTEQLAVAKLSEAFFLLPAYWEEIMLLLQQAWEQAALHRQSVRNSIQYT